MAKIIGVANSTPLIALSLIGRLDLLKELLGETLVPALVYHEVVPLGGTRPGVREVSQADWLIIKEPETVSPFPPRAFGIGSRRA